MELVNLRSLLIKEEHEKDDSLRPNRFLRSLSNSFSADAFPKLLNFLD